MTYHHNPVDWLVDTAMRGVIYRTISTITRGLSSTEMLLLAAIAVVGYLTWRTRT